MLGEVAKSIESMFQTFIRFWFIPLNYLWLYIVCKKRDRLNFIRLTDHFHHFNLNTLSSPSHSQVQTSFFQSCCVLMMNIHAEPPTQYFWREFLINFSIFFLLFSVSSTGQQSFKTRNCIMPTFWPMKLNNFIHHDRLIRTNFSYSHLCTIKRQ